MDLLKRSSPYFSRVSCPGHGFSKSIFAFLPKTTVFFYTKIPGSKGKGSWTTSDSIYLSLCVAALQQGGLLRSIFSDIRLGWLQEHAEHSLHLQARHFRQDDSTTLKTLEGNDPQRIAKGHSLRIYPYPMVWPLPRPWSETMVSIPLWAQKTLEIKGFLGLERPFLDLVSRTPRPRGRGRPLFAEKGPEKRCRAKIVEKCRKTFWHFLTIFDVFCPCAKIVEKCRKTFWHFLTIFDVFWCGPFSAGPFCNPLKKTPTPKTRFSLQEF